MNEVKRKKSKIHYDIHGEGHAALAASTFRKEWAYVFVPLNGITHRKFYPSLPFFIKRWLRQILQNVQPLSCPLIAEASADNSSRLSEQTFSTAVLDPLSFSRHNVLQLH
ncbi:hypothetical protein [Pseudalkalibacillus caeni]|uniref:Uncharacterized protein n=1 Tax=Exobacillus caeni TaxID=2574798 RepID=A0A5R9FFH4_9BACL|nr:hypothetical protein [Pseudalkalibacillus caeni]TLS38315.1 hypothetical protein FCL54_07260 [Pseudalkalibacillus caeni]